MSPSTRLTPSERKPQEMIASSTPCERTQSSMKERKGRPASGITGFGVVYVSGRSRVPSPPASTRACIRDPPPGSPPDPLVGETSGHERLAVQEVAAVHYQRHAHPALHVTSPVELPELRPLGDEHHGVGALHRVERRLADPSAGEQGVRLPRRHRVVNPHVRAFPRESPGEHQAGRLASVVRIRLERHPEQRHLPPAERPQVLLQLPDGAPLLKLVDLDDGGEELEVIAGVAGELLESLDIFGKALLYTKTAASNKRVGPRNLHRVHLSLEPPSLHT